MTIFEAYNSTKKQLAAAGCEDEVFEAKQIIKHITGLTSAEILTHYNNTITMYQQNNLTAIVKQRAAHYPLQYIFGEWGFYGCRFKVGPGVLIPRQDTETLVDTALEFLKDKESPEVLDLCSGSGCIGITLAKQKPLSKVTLVEKYEEAMRYLKENIKLNGAENATAVLADVFEPQFDNEFDIIVSNPPYIPTDEMDLLSYEVKFEPETALYGGEDGLLFYRFIAADYIKYLKKGGMLAFEVGINEADAVCEILLVAGYKDIKKQKDLNGIYRVVSGKAL